MFKSFKNCCVPNCIKKHRERIKLHRFPINKRIRQLWVNLINYETLLELNLDDLDNYRICNKHFEKRFYISNNFRQSYWAVPTLFTDVEISTGVPRVHVETDKKIIDNQNKLNSFDHNYHKSPIEVSFPQYESVRIVATDKKTIDNQIKLNSFDHNYHKSPIEVSFPQYETVLIEDPENKQNQIISHDVIPRRKAQPLQVCLQENDSRPKTQIIIKKFKIPTLDGYMKSWERVAPLDDVTATLPPEDIYDPSKPPIHENVFCNNCKEEIKRFRYKCVTCHDYDLCMKCEMQELHPEHYMLRISHPAKFIKANIFIEKWRRYSKPLTNNVLHNILKENNNDVNDNEPIVKSDNVLSEDIKEKIREEVSRVIIKNKVENVLNTTFGSEKDFLEIHLDENKTEKPKDISLGVNKPLTSIKHVKRKRVDCTDMDNTPDNLNPIKIAKTDQNSELLLYHKHQSDHVKKLVASSLQKIQLSADQSPSSMETLQEPLLNKPEVPLSNKLHIPLSNKLQSPLSNKLQDPLSSKLQDSLSNKQLQHPQSNKLQDPVSNKLQDPLSNQQLQHPQSNKLQDPVSNKLQDPLSNQQLQHPQSNKLQDQLLHKLQYPLSNKLQVPLSNKLQVPLSNKLQDPLSNKLQDPLSNKIQDPVSNKLQDPLSNKLQDQLSNKLRVPRSNKQLQHSQPSKQQDPLLNKLQVPLSNKLQAPLSNKLQDPLSNILQDPLFNKLQDPLSNKLQDPLSNKLQDPLSNKLRVPRSNKQLQHSQSRKLQDPLFNKLQDPLSNKLQDPLSNDSGSSNKLRVPRSNKQLQHSQPSKLQYPLSNKLQAPLLNKVQDPLSNKKEDNI